MIILPGNRIKAISQNEPEGKIITKYLRAEEPDQKLSEATGKEEPKV